MKLTLLSFVAILGSVPVFGNITYTCNSSVDAYSDANACATLNSTVSGYYLSTFSNANANIYITMGSTVLGESSQYYNYISYTSYVADLTANANQDALQASALSALNTYDATPYGTDNVEITAALGSAFGLTGLTGIVEGAASGNGSSCTLGVDANCYNGFITISNGETYYYDDQGGSESAGEFDFYAVVQHETDEVLGTASCISTSNPLTDGCGGSTPSAVDLYRYSSAGTLVTTSDCIGQSSCPSGAYFSYNGGTSNGADGFVYNTVGDDNDYADFLGGGCGTGPFSIQDAASCGGSGNPQDKGLTILSDGGAEVNILNAVGYDLNTVPEPADLALVGIGLAVLGFARRLKK